MVQLTETKAQLKLDSSVSAEVPSPAADCMPCKRRWTNGDLASWPDPLLCTARETYQYISNHLGVGNYARE